MNAARRRARARKHKGAQARGGPLRALAPHLRTIALASLLMQPTGEHVIASTRVLRVDHPWYLLLSQQTTKYHAIVSLACFMRNRRLKQYLQNRTFCT